MKALLEGERSEMGLTEAGDARRAASGAAPRQVEPAQGTDAGVEVHGRARDGLPVDLLAQDVPDGADEVLPTSMFERIGDT